MALTVYPWELEDGPQTKAELVYIGLVGGKLWECIGERPDGNLDTAYGNSQADALDRARKAGLK